MMKVWQRIFILKGIKKIHLVLRLGGNNGQENPNTSAKDWALVSVG